MADGKIKKTGGSDLALELEKKGYEWTDNFIKKILEIIPSSEVISIQELENDKLMKREENE